MPKQHAKRPQKSARIDLSQFAAGRKQKEPNQNKTSNNHEDMIVESDDDTCTADNTTMVDPHCARVTVIFKLPPSPDPTNTLIKMIRDFLTNGSIVDSNFALLPWYTKPRVPVSPFVTAQQIPSDLTMLQTHSPKLFPKKHNNKQDVYRSFYIRHTEEYSEFSKAMKPWLSSHNHRMYTKKIQCERSMDIAWLCYSSKHMNADRIQAEILKDTGIEVGVMWKTIATGAKGEIPESKKVRALHLEANYDTHAADLIKLSNTYGRTDSGFSCGRKLRLFPVRSKVKSLQGQTQLTRARERQKTFLELLMNEMSTDLIDKDMQYGDLIPLREMISKIKSVQYPNLHLFVSVDRYFWSSESHLFLYMPNMENEAIMMINNLYPYLKGQYGEDVHH